MDAGARCEMVLTPDDIALIFTALHLITGLCSFVLAGFVYAASVRSQVKVSIAPTRQHHNLNSTLVAVFLLGVAMDMFAITFSVSLPAHLGAVVLSSVSGVATVALFIAQMVRRWN